MQLTRGREVTVMRLGCALVLLAAARMVAASLETEGCATWELTRDNSNACCTLCFPGTRLVQKCGKKPKELCTFCESGTFTTVPGVEQCQKCTECTEFQQEHMACTSTQDTVCVCKKGYRCSDPKCSSCELQCPKGQELVGGSCQPCPEGTFQNGTQQTCIAWTKKCPNPDHHVVIKGSPAHDVVCGPVSDAHYGWMVATLVITAAIFVLPIVAYALGSHMRMKRLYEQQLPEKHLTDPSRAERRPVQEHCCLPQQEQGSDLSLDSQDSDEKLVSYPCLLGAERV